MEEIVVRILWAVRGFLILGVLQIFVLCKIVRVIEKMNKKL